MQPFNALKLALQNYANFSGRAARGDYWWYFIAYIVILITLGSVDKSLFDSGSTHLDTSEGLRFSFKAGPLNAIWLLASFVPSLSLGARRLHDTGRSGWMQMLVLIPILGGLYLLYLFSIKGDAGDNHFGPDPLV